MSLCTLCKVPTCAHFELLGQGLGCPDFECPLQSRTEPAALKPLEEEGPRLSVKAALHWQRIAAQAVRLRGHHMGARCVLTAAGHFKAADVIAREVASIDRDLAAISLLLNRYQLDAVGAELFAQDAQLAAVTPLSPVTPQNLAP